MTRLWTILGRIWEILTGECFFWRGHPNGGRIIMYRSILISLSMYLVALWLRSLLNADCPACHPDLGAMFHDAGGTLPWLGAIYLAVYAALYTRFSNQMNHLCNTHNLLMQTQANLENPDDNAKIQIWKVALVEYADDLHLATKPLFSVLCYRILNDATLGPLFEQHTVNGPKRRENLQKTLLKKIGPNLPAAIVTSSPGRTPPDQTDR